MNSFTHLFLKLFLYINIQTERNFPLKYSIKILKVDQILHFSSESRVSLIKIKLIAKIYLYLNKIFFQILSRNSDINIHILPTFFIRKS